MAQAAAQQPFKFGSKGTSVDWDEVAKSSEMLATARVSDV
jgi:hypothetical protein